MSHPEVTMATETIHNPAEPRHFMRAKPVSRIVRVRRGGALIAESSSALRITEMAKDMLDPVLYLPKEDVIAPLSPIEGKSSHCPLKGDASYFSVDATGAPIAWTYQAAFDFAKVINGRVAFYPDEVSIEEVGSAA